MPCIKQQNGYSIVELMIASTMGLLLLAGVMQLFLGSNQNFTLQGQLATVQENGRFALMFLEEQIQKASWYEGTNDIPKAINMAGSAEGGGTANDSVAVSFNALINGTDNLDCNGVAVASGIVVNRFFISDTDNLMCQGNGGGVAQPLLPNVESFQVLYGVETDKSCSDGVVNSYLTKTAVENRSLSSHILSVRIGLLLKAEKNVLLKSESKTFQVLDQSVTKNDMLIRRLFQQTIFMPNAVYAAVGSPAAILSCSS